MSRFRTTCKKAAIGSKRPYLVYEYLRPESVNDGFL